MWCRSRRFAATARRDREGDPMSKRDDENPITHLVEELVEVAAASQAAGLHLLQAEMQALSQVLPGAAAPQSDAERAAADLAVEAEFDNMPV